MPIRPYKSPAQPFVDTAAVEARDGPPRSQEEIENRSINTVLDTVVGMVFQWKTCKNIYSEYLIMSQVYETERDK